MKIYIDMDGVFWDTVQTICNLYNDDFSLYPGFKMIAPWKVNSWKFEELELADWDYLDHYFSQPRFFEDILPMPLACSTCEILTLDYDIVFVTIGTKANLEGKRRWLADNFEAKYDFIGLDINEYHDKSSVDMSDGIFIDDSSSNLKTSNAAVKICYGQKLQWNEDWDGMRLKYWTDVYEFIINYDPTIGEEE